MNKQRGFSLVEGLLVVLIFSVVGFGGYYVWSQNNEDEPDQTETVQQNTDEKSTEGVEEPLENEVLISEDWERYESGQEAYSIKISDGLDGIRDTTTDFFFFRSFVDTEGAAVVRDTDGFGTDGFSALTISQQETSNMWNPTDIENLVEEEFVASSGTIGLKKTFNYPYLPPCEGLGCYLGEKNVVYEFTNGLKTIRIWYSRQIANEETKRIFSITEDSPDFTEEIDAMAKSLVVN